MRYALGLLSLSLVLSLSACDSGPGPNEMPRASFTFSPQSPQTGRSVSFTSNATDSDGEIVSHSWDLDGDGVQDATGRTATFTYEQPGTITVRLTVTDDRDDSNTSTRAVSVELPPNELPSAAFTYSPENPRAGTVVDFTANASDTDGQVEQYSWDFNGDGLQDASGPNPTHAFQEQGRFNVQLTVTDDRGGEATADRSVDVSQRFTQVRVTKATVQEMPFTNDQGQGWDFSSGPEVYFTAFDSSDQRLVTSNYHQDVAPSELPISFEGADFLIDDFSEEYRVFLVDYDAASGDDSIGGIIFTIDGLGIVGDYPNSTTLDARGIRMDLELEWLE